MDGDNQLRPATEKGCTDRPQNACTNDQSPEPGTAFYFHNHHHHHEMHTMHVAEDGVGKCIPKRHLSNVIFDSIQSVLVKYEIAPVNKRATVTMHPLLDSTE
ncbi:hypothetical protein ZHAS_00011647 [Anopheles sinensis]|uniref:Uncharacterized protein n=1 Tax=Anopheles sinensis TaxID=74873 RepID=A0A084W0R1_ANOSI|nr:hypothetical protein ZHAS_00011647 [Anopheles sinensis]